MFMCLFHDESVCCLWNEIWAKSFYKSQGDFYTKALALVLAWSDHATCGKFFQSIIGEETTKKVTYMKFEHKILSKIIWIEDINLWLLRYDIY
jgi:hypothetical protein